MYNYTLSVNTITKSSVRSKDLFVFIISFLCFCFVLFFNNKDHYFLLPVMPLAYGFCYLFVLAPVLSLKKSMTGFLVAICEFLRCVFMPIVIVCSDYSGFGVFSTIDRELLDHALLLMLYELFITFVFLNLTIRNYLINIPISINKTLKNRKVLFLLVGIGFVIFTLTPQLQNSINFMLLNPDSEKVRALSAGEFGSVFTAISAYVHQAFLCIFILILDYCSRKYNIYDNKKYVRIAIISGLLTVCVIFGESRSGIIYTLFAVVSCLLFKFPNYKKRIVVSLSLSAIFILLGMTLYRLFAVYSFSSYDVAFASGGLRQNYFSGFMEAYLLGPQSVAAGLEFSNIFSDDFTFERFLYDLFRPFMGFNIFLKDFNLQTSITMYNSWIFDTVGKSNGVFLQITNQCYCYLGFIFSPLFACFFIGLSIKLENWMKRTDNLFVFFFLNYVFIRTSTCVLGGTMSGYITTCSMTLLLTTAFFLTQKLLGRLVK